MFRIFNLLPSLGAMGFIVALMVPNTFIQYYGRLFPGLLPSTFITIILISDLIKLLYLFWPHLPRHLGSYYLPLGVALSILTPLLRTFFVLQSNPMWFYENFPREVYQAYFVIPLIFLAWQYGFKSVAIYCSFLTLIEVYMYIKLLPLEVDLWIILQSSIVLILSHLIIGYIITALVTAQQQQRNALARANTQLLQYGQTLEQLAESRERNRLARELHDTLAHYLSGSILHLNGAKALWNSDKPKARSMVNDAVQTLSEGLHETRKAIQTLRSSPVELLGLKQSLEDFIRHDAERLGLDVTLTLKTVPNISEPSAQSLYHIAQELMRNIERHAQATHLAVVLKPQGKDLLLGIEDNGVGFHPEHVDTTRHFGLLGLEERVRLLQGTTSIHSRPNQGTRVEIRIPLDTL